MAPKLTEVGQSAASLGLLDALSVTPESITSRVVVNNPLIRVVYFAFDTGEVLTDHSSPRAVVVQLLDGQIRLSYDGLEQALRPGDVVYLAPGTVHAVVADAPSHLSLVMVDPDATPRP
ncbi:MAG: cupin domain-containing protein [Actinomycetes bacterium]